MNAKLFEIRDHATFIPMLGVLLDSTGRHQPTTLEERYLLRRDGFGEEPLVLLCQLAGKCEYDPYCWGGRTFPVAHDYIAKHWNELESGAVVDVRFILGETTAPAVAERGERYSDDGGIPAEFET